MTLKQAEAVSKTPLPSARGTTALFPQRTGLRILFFAVVLCGAVFLSFQVGIPGVIASCQIAAATVTLAGSRRRPLILAAMASLGACAVWPQAAALLAALGRFLVYAGLYQVFVRSLRAGQVPIATRLARRIHPVLSESRLTYTKAVTWLWTVFFAAQSILWLCILAASPVHQPPHWAFWADLPLATALLTGELVVRSVVFRGQPHGSFADMIRAFRAPAE